MPKADSTYENLVNKIQRFYVKLMEFRFKRYERDSKQSKQDDCSVLIAFHAAISNKVKEFKEELTLVVNI